MPETRIRRADPDDARLLSDLGARTFRETFGHLYDPGDLRDFLAEIYAPDRTRAGLEDPRNAWWLAEADGAPAGYVLAGPCALPHPGVTSACGEIKRLYLLGPHQGGGLGGRLLGTALDWLEADGPRDLWIGVWSENHGAQRFYGRRGFKKVGEYDFPVGRSVDREFIMRRRKAQA